MPRTRNIAIFVLLLGVVGLGLQCNKGGAGKPPLIFLIVLDAASAPYFGCYGDSQDTSPNIDRLAAESIVFENAYSQSATTGPSTSSMITGTRVTTHKMWRKSPLEQSFETIAELMGKQGYDTAAVIANPNAAGAGLDQGYQQWIEVYMVESVQEKRSARKLQGRYPVPVPEDVNEQVFGLLPKLKEKPFYFYIHYLQPHAPYDPPPAFMDRFDPHKLGTCDCHGYPAWDGMRLRMAEASNTGQADEALIKHAKARYRANIQYVDSAVGELIRHLKEAGLYDEALIIVTSDHGEAFFDHKKFEHNTTLYDDMTLIPLIMKFPAGHGTAPARIPQLVEAIDLMPTILDVAGIPAPDRVEGESLLPLIRGEAAELESGEVVVSTSRRKKHAIRMGPFKYLMGHEGGDQLYDLRADPMELENLAAKNPKVMGTLDLRLRALIDVKAAEDEPAAKEEELDPRIIELLEALGYVDGGE
ncbi:MAG: sulfatase family protein [Planctomycetota bacterium]|jgi:arylsulfatase A-like enzyme